MASVVEAKGPVPALLDCPAARVIRFRTYVEGTVGVATRVNNHGLSLGLGLLWFVALDALQCNGGVEKGVGGVDCPRGCDGGVVDGQALAVPVAVVAVGQKDGILHRLF